MHKSTLSFIPDKMPAPFVPLDKKKKMAANTQLPPMLMKVMAMGNARLLQVGLALPPMLKTIYSLTWHFHF